MNKDALINALRARTKYKITNLRVNMKGYIFDSIKEQFNEEQLKMPMLSLWDLLSQKERKENVQKIENRTRKELENCFNRNEMGKVKSEGIDSNEEPSSLKPTKFELKNENNNEVTSKKNAVEPSYQLEQDNILLLKGKLKELPEINKQENKAEALKKSNKKRSEKRNEKVYYENSIDNEFKTDSVENVFSDVEPSKSLIESKETLQIFDSNPELPLNSENLEIYDNEPIKKTQRQKSEINKKLFLIKDSKTNSSALQNKETFH